MYLLFIYVLGDDLLFDLVIGMELLGMFIWLRLWFIELFMYDILLFNMLLFFLLYIEEGDVFYFVFDLVMGKVIDLLIFFRFW